jgi:hypothetical protein
MQLSESDVPDGDHVESSELLPASERDGGSLRVHRNGIKPSYSYGPSGLAGLWHNQYALLCAVFASIGGLTFGYDQGVIANVLVMKDFVARWPVGPWEKGLMSAFFAGYMRSGSHVHLCMRQLLCWSWARCSVLFLLDC